MVTTLSRGPRKGKCAGVEIRKEIELGAGRIWWVTDEAAARLRKSGDLIPTGESHFIPRHTANTPADLLALLGEYGTFAARFGGRCMFRGQTRDYFDEKGDLRVMPSSFRTPKLRKLFAWIPGQRTSRLDDKLQTWERVLSSCGVDTDTRLKRKMQLNGGGSVYIQERAATVRVALNHELGAILQHYGFPTPHLDVTGSAAVALYFALHKVEKRPGGIRFEPLAARSTEATCPSSTIEPAPAIHVYIVAPKLEPWAPYVDLCSLESLVKVARRPVLQRANSLTCVVHEREPSGDEDYPHKFSVGYQFRFPAAIIKLRFPYAAARGQFEPFTQNQLFPTDELIYQALLKADAPHLVRYDGKRAIR
jgi:FRG domain